MGEEEEEDGEIGKIFEGDIDGVRGLSGEVSETVREASGQEEQEDTAPLSGWATQRNPRVLWSPDVGMAEELEHLGDGCEHPGPSQSSPCSPCHLHCWDPNSQSLGA